MAKYEKLNEEGAMNNNLKSSTYMKNKVIKPQSTQREKMQKK